MKITLESAERYKGPMVGGKRQTETLFFVDVDGVLMKDKWKAAADTPGERKTLAKERFLRDFATRPLEGSIRVPHDESLRVGEFLKVGTTNWKVQKVYPEPGYKTIVILVSEPGSMKANPTAAKYEVHPNGRDPKETRPISSHETLEEVAQSYADRDVLVTRKHGAPLSVEEADELEWHCNEWLNGPED